jgi:hypothetical protein
MGYQGDEGSIPDEDCQWFRPVGSIHNAQNGGIGGPLTGAVANSYVTGYWMGGETQPMFTGTIGRDGEGDGDGEVDPSGINHDLNRQSRDEKTQGGDFRYKSSGPDKVGEYDDKSITKYASDESPNPYKRKKAKETDEETDKAWSLGMHEYA